MNSVWMFVGRDEGGYGRYDYELRLKAKMLRLCI